jgi:hypothetical protein
MTPLKSSSVSHKIKIKKKKTMTPATHDLSLTPDEMTVYLTQLYGKPCVLREEGADEILCPYCGDFHFHAVAHGHYCAGCAGYNFEIILNSEGIPTPVAPHITIGSRSFNPAYGYDIYEYKTITEGTNTHYLITPLPEPSKRSE